MDGLCVYVPFMSLAPGAYNRIGLSDHAHERVSHIHLKRLFPQTKDIYVYILIIRIMCVHSSGTTLNRKC